MIKDSYSEKDTWELGFSLGEKAGTGQIFTLIGDLGVGKPFLRKDWPEGWESPSR